MKSQTFRYFLLLIALALTFAVKAQNLVPNPSFETAATCPSNNTFTAATWYSPSTGSPDYFNPCGTGWTIPGAGVLFGPQTARTGNSFAAVGWYGLGGGWYEYIQVPLSTPLVAGQVYTFSMWVSLADGVMRAGDDLGVYFSGTPFKSTGSIQPTISTIVPTTPANFGVFTSLVPQIKCVDGAFITDAVNWTELSGTYTASGGEQAITIGCFEPWATTGKFTANASGNDRVYYYVDDVSLQQVVPLPLELLSFSGTTNSDNTVELSWQTDSENNVCYFQVERSKDGVNFQGLEHLIAEGNTTNLSRYVFTDQKPIRDINYYRLKTVDCDGKIAYSEIISLKRESILTEIYPNPILDELTILFENPTPKTICLQDSYGSLVFQTYCSGDRLVIPFKELSKGTYTLVIRSENLPLCVRKVIKN